jgi:heavy metal translocating P-type ATPase
VLHVFLRVGPHTAVSIGALRVDSLPLVVCLLVGGVPLIVGLLDKLAQGKVGTDLLAGVSIVTSAVLGEYLAGSVVVLMLAGGEALEAYAVRRASSVLEALARRTPSRAHRKSDGVLSDASLDDIAVGDELIIFPHEICPVDGTVLDGNGTMDESFLTGEPYLMPKTPGSMVISGAINGDAALTIRAERPADDSRYARIMRVMRGSERQRPALRRLGDRLGAAYTPLALAVAMAAWAGAADPSRFLAVVVVATPCPLLIAIPVAIIGAISLAARRGIVIKDPAILEALGTCRTAIFDKTGTLTYGRPALTEVIPLPGVDSHEILALVASLERYSKHPLAAAVVESAADAGVPTRGADHINEPPGQGLTGTVGGREILVTGRKQIVARDPATRQWLPPVAGGLECMCVIDGRYAATLRFHDRPRDEGPSFICHLGPCHHFDRVLLVTGDRESEARYLAKLVGIDNVLADQSPEQKLEIVRRETRRANTLFVGDGINDAPALTAATVGVVLGQNSDITGEAAGAVILDSSLDKVDELLHVGHRLRSIALQSAVGGMAVSVVAMLFAAAGYLPPVAGAIVQEVIDLLAVSNSLRVSLWPGTLTDFGTLRDNRGDDLIQRKASSAVRETTETETFHDLCSRHSDDC